MDNDIEIDWAQEMVEEMAEEQKLYIFMAIMDADLLSPEDVDEIVADAKTARMESASEEKS